MSYFIRHTNNPQADLERGYSFVAYNLWSTKELALETLAEDAGVTEEDDFDFDSYIEDNEYRVGQDNVTGLWGPVRSGLCAYVGYETEAEAQQALAEGDYQYGSGGDLTSFAVIFEGSRTFDNSLDGQDDGITFRPIRIVLVQALA